MEMTVYTEGPIDAVGNVIIDGSIAVIKVIGGAIDFIMP